MPNDPVFDRRASASDGTVPERVSDGFNMVKAWHGRTLTATCEMWTHELGWKLRLLIDGHDLQMTRVVRSSVEMLTTVDEWRADMAEFGWR